MSATPETDLNECWPASNLKLGDSSVVPAKFARKLERERDEARKALRTLAEHGESEIQRVTKERDEAIADLEFRRGLYKVLEGANNHLMTANQEVAKLARTLKQERDEARNASEAFSALAWKLEGERNGAREQIKELIYIAERAIALAEIDFENDKFGVVSELRNGLEKIMEAAK